MFYNLRYSLIKTNVISLKVKYLVLYHLPEAEVGEFLPMAVKNFDIFYMYFSNVCLVFTPNI